MDRFDTIVTETVRSGNEPLQLTYVGVYDGHLGRPVAYRTQTQAFCASVGVLRRGYEDAADGTETGKALTYRNLVHALREEKELSYAGKEFEWISVRASLSFLLGDTLYDDLGKILEDEKSTSPEKICFELNRSIFSADRAKVRKGLTELKTLGFKTLLGNFATDGFPITTLLDVPVDYVVLTPEVTALAVDRNKEDVLPSLVRFLRSMNVETIAAGVKNDDEIRELNKMECYGVLPDATYEGRFSFRLREEGKYGYREAIATEEDEA